MDTTVIPTTDMSKGFTSYSTRSRLIVFADLDDTSVSMTITNMDTNETQQKTAVLPPFPPARRQGWGRQISLDYDGVAVLIVYREMNTGDFVIYRVPLDGSASSVFSVSPRSSGKSFFIDRYVKKSLAPEARKYLKDYETQTAVPKHYPFNVVGNRDTFIVVPVSPTEFVVSNPDRIVRFEMVAGGIRGNVELLVNNHSDRQWLHLGLVALSRQGTKAIYALSDQHEEDAVFIVIDVPSASVIHSFVGSIAATPRFSDASWTKILYFAYEKLYLIDLKKTNLSIHGSLLQVSEDQEIHFATTPDLDKIAHVERPKGAFLASNDEDLQQTEGGDVKVVIRPTTDSVVSSKTIHYTATSVVPLVLTENNLWAICDDALVGVRYA